MYGVLTNMTLSQQKYLELLRCGLWDSECDIVPDRDVARIAVQQSTTALVLKDSEDEDCLQEVKRVMWSHGKLNAVIAELVGMLDSCGIKSVLLKGQGCATNYPEPMLRNCGDIDLYVGEESFERACEVLTSMDGMSVDDYDCFHHSQFHYKDVKIELHRKCLDLSVEGRQEAIDALAAEGLTGDLPTINLMGCRVRVPEVNFNAVYVFAHMVHHFISGGIGFRQVCDWIMLLHANRDVIDKCALERMLATLRLRKTWELFGYIAVNYLGLPKDEMPFYCSISKRKAEMTLEKIFTDGNFGYANEHPALKRIRKCPLFIVRKSLTMGLYTVEFFRKRRMYRELVPLAGLLDMYSVGFSSTFSKHKREDK